MPSAEAGQKAAVNGAMPNAGQKQTPDRAREMDRELARTGVALNAVLERYGLSSIQEMDGDTYRKAMNSLKKTRARVV